MEGKATGMAPRPFGERNSTGLSRCVCSPPPARCVNRHPGKALGSVLNSASKPCNSPSIPPCAIGSRDGLTGPLASSYPSPMPQTRRRRTNPRGRGPRAQRRGEALEGGDRPTPSLTGPDTAGADRRGAPARPVRAARPARASGPGVWYAALFADLVLFLGCGLLAERLLPPTGRTVAWIVLIMTFGVGAGWLWGRARQLRRHPEVRHE